MDDVSELIAKLDMLGNSAHERAIGFHVQLQKHREFSPKYRSLLNDYFYWSGKATAYKGIAAGLVLRDMVARDEDAEATCP